MATTKGNVLVVDDELLNRILLATSLEEEGYSVEMAEDGRQAMVMIESQAFDVVLLDILMPEVYGFDVLAWMKSHEKLRHIPVIIISAVDDMESIVRCIEMGATDYLQKPFDPTLLRARINASLSSKRLRELELEMARQALQADMEIARHRSVAQMVAGVAHEINTPLGIINTAANIIKQRLMSETMTALAKEPQVGTVVQDLVEAGDLIERNIGRAHKLVQDFKRVSVNQITDIKEQGKLAEVVAETAYVFQVSARQSKMEVTIHNTLPDQAGEWFGYPGSLSQVILNLLTNAQRFGYPDGVGGRVEITIAEDHSSPEAGYRLSVRDFGKGIAPEHLPLVFDPFFTTGRGKGGSGLGLAIVYNIVTAHLKGAITIDSVVEQGTTVTLTFPRIIPDSGDNHQ